VIGKATKIQLSFNISSRQIEIILKGGIINYIRQR
ncbi:MAG: aconitate hydratase, partial [Vicingaceae bacterium]